MLIRALTEKIIYDNFEFNHPEDTRYIEWRKIGMLNSDNLFFRAETEKVLYLYDIILNLEFKSFKYFFVVCQ